LAGWAALRVIVQRSREGTVVRRPVCFRRTRCLSVRSYTLQQQQKIGLENTRPATSHGNGSARSHCGVELASAFITCRDFRVPLAASTVRATRNQRVQHALTRVSHAQTHADLLASSNYSTRASATCKCANILNPTAGGWLLALSTCLSVLCLSNCFASLQSESQCNAHE
jgi:hypothetical protein